MPGYDTRKPILRAIERARDSKVLLYATGDRRGMETQISGDVIDLVVNHLDVLWPTDKISLLLYTTGGDTATAWRLANLLRTFCEDLEVIVWSKALSAGTLISLASDRIVMTKQAALGPIDPSLNNPLNPPIPGGAPNHKAPVSVEAVQGYLDVVQKQLRIDDATSLAAIWNHLSDKIHPLVLGQIFRTRSQIRTLANRLLVHQEIKNDKRETIISFLCGDSGSHDHTINRREAEGMGLIVEKPTEQFYRVLKRLHQSISETLSLASPYSLDTQLGAAANTHYLARRALVESVKHGSHQYISEGELTRIQVTQGGMTQPAVNDTRLFEGWRKEA